MKMLLLLLRHPAVGESTERVRREPMSTLALRRRLLLVMILNLEAEVRVLARADVLQVVDMPGEEVRVPADIGIDLGV